jgi:excisionase family DNA binding protein
MASREFAMADRKVTGRHITHLGSSIPAAAQALNVPEGTVRRAVENKEIEVVWFGGLRRVPPREIDRIRAEFGQVEE